MHPFLDGARYTRHVIDWARSYPAARYRRELKSDQRGFNSALGFQHGFSSYAIVFPERAAILEVSPRTFGGVCVARSSHPTASPDHRQMSLNNNAFVRPQQLTTRNAASDISLSFSFSFFSSCFLSEDHFPCLYCVQRKNYCVS